MTEVDSLGESSGSGSGDGVNWKGAEAPRGYSDITDQIELRDLEVLNADEAAGGVRVLFEGSKPSGLGNGKGTSKDYVQSGADDQLLLYVPFQSIVKLHTLQASLSLLRAMCALTNTCVAAHLPPSQGRRRCDATWQRSPVHQPHPQPRL